MKFTLFLALFSSLLISCGKDVDPSKSQSVSSLENLGKASGNFRLIATDAPFSYDGIASAKVIIKQIDAKSSGDRVSSVLATPKTIDLVQLKNGLVSVVIDLNLPAGEYKELNLIIESGSVDLKTGEHFNLKIPSGASSGLKLAFNPALNITTGASEDILLDIDLARSFVPQGDSKDASTITGFHFKPTLRMANLTTAGTVSGKVISDNGTTSTADDIKLAGAVVKVSQGETVISTAVTDALGNFKIIGLPEGSYSMAIESVGYNTSSSVNFSITAGNVTTAGETLLVKQPVVAAE